MGYRFVLSFIKSTRLLALYYNRSRNKQNQKNNCVQTTTIKTDENWWLNLGLEVGQRPLPGYDETVYFRTEISF